MHKRVNYDRSIETVEHNRWRISSFHSKNTIVDERDSYRNNYYVIIVIVVVTFSSDYYECRCYLILYYITLEISRFETLFHVRFE